jgi:hypothetical protein
MIKVLNSKDIDITSFRRQNTEPDHDDVQYVLCFEILVYFLVVARTNFHKNDFFSSIPRKIMCAHQSFQGRRQTNAAYS